MPKNDAFAVKSFYEKNIWLRSILGFGVSGILLWLTFYKSGLKLRDLNMDRTELCDFALADIFFLISVWVYSLRAKLFWLSDRKGFKDIYSFESIVIGNFYNCLLPGNLGDGVRAWHFSKKNQVPFLQSLSPIFAEKWLDAQYFILLTIGLLLARPFVENYVLYAIVYTAAGAAGLLMVYGLMRFNRRFERMMLKTALLFKGAGKVVLRIYWFTTRSIDGLRKRKLVAGYFLLCACVYVLNVLQFFYLLKSAGVSGVEGGVYSAYLCAMSMMIIAFIPSAPGNIGVLHYGLYSALILAAIQSGIHPDELRLQSYARFAVYVHLSYIIPEILIGAVFVVKERRLMF